MSPFVQALGPLVMSLTMLTVDTCVSPQADLSWRRRATFLLASSYGAVYATLRQNGRRMYVVDAVDGRDSLFELDGAALGRHLEVTQATAAAGRAFIRERVDAIAEMYQYTSATGKPDKPR